MRILHTSDWHLGISFQGRMFLEDQQFFINEICNIVKKEQIDCVLIAGDVYDRSIAGNEAIDLFDSCMKRICLDLGTKVMVIAGNHDGARRLSTCSELLKKSGLFIAGALEKDAFVYEEGNVSIFLLPWISTDKARAVFPEKADEIKTIEDAYRVSADNCRAAFKEGNVNILCAHAFITNSETSVSDRAAVVGTATEVSASVFDGFDYVALGHIHKPQDVNEHVRYSGTPMPYSFGKEETQEKSVTVFDTETLEKTVILLPLYRKRMTLTGTYEEIMTGDYPKEVTDAYIRVKLTDSPVTLETFARLNELFPNLLEAAGTTLNDDGMELTLTPEDLEQRKNNPEEIFRQYYIDSFGMEPDEHLASLFEKALEMYSKEVEE